MGRSVSQSPLIGLAAATIHNSLTGKSNTGVLPSSQCGQGRQPRSLTEEDHQPGLTLPKQGHRATRKASATLRPHLTHAFSFIKLTGRLYALAVGPTSDHSRQALVLMGDNDLAKVTSEENRPGRLRKWP
jgi:hypothetical protein